MAYSSSDYAVWDALALPGCPICRLGAETAERYLDGLLWEMVNDPGVREKVRKAQGFCNAHAWLMTRVRGAALGVAIIHHDVLSTLVETLGSATVNDPSPVQAVRNALAGERAPGGSAAASRLEPRGECPACVQVSGAEERHVDALLGNLLRDEQFRALFRASDGLCQQHLRRALLRAREGAAVDALIGAQREIWERLVAQLSEFVRKNDYRFCHEPMGVEGDAWLRSIAALSGQRGHEERISHGQCHKTRTE